MEHENGPPLKTPSAVFFQACSNAPPVGATSIFISTSATTTLNISILEVVRRYTEATELTQRMVAELIDHIEVYHAKHENGLKIQEIKIHYNCIGPFEVPDWNNIPELQVYIKTRKGVALSYSQTEKVG